MKHVDLYELQRLARTATDLGHYNLAKLLNAATLSVVNRSLYAESLPKTDRALAQAIEAIEPMLIEARLDPQLVASIRRARSIIAAGNLILYQDAPPLFVCRVCGEVARAAPPDHCPHCGAGQLTFQNIVTAYYLEPISINEVLDQLSRTPDWLDQTLSSLTPDQLTQTIGGVEAEWSLQEAAAHLLDTQQLIAHRVQLFLASEAPSLTAVAAWETVASASLSAHQIASSFRQSREAMLAQLRAAPPDRWTRIGQHAEFGPVTLQQQCSYFAKHEQWHMAQITRINHTLAQQ